VRCRANPLRRHEDGAKLKTMSSTPITVRQLTAAERRLIIGPDPWKFWKTIDPIEYTGGRGDHFYIEPGFHTDFASVPRVFAWFIPRYGRYTRAAILHDHLAARARRGDFPWRDADGIFRRVMREDGVPFLQRWVMWAGVRWGALTEIRSGGLRGWWRDAPWVLATSIVALPVLLLPAIAIALSYLVFLVYETVAWVVLSIGRLAKRSAGREPEKQLNRPRFTTHT
jgi:Protein of unknown function (DUF1353)